MNNTTKQRSTRKFIRFSIGAKMVLIISIIVLMSLGSVITLASWLSREDLRVLAEETNFEMNRRSAIEAEIIISKMRSDSLLLIQIVNALGFQSEAPISAASQTAASQAIDLFFAANNHIASIFFFTPGSSENLLVNPHFFNTRDIDPALAESYRATSESMLLRAALGETLLRNATPHFSVSLLAMFFPWQNGGAAVLFSPETLESTFGEGVNQSYLVNDTGDILIHSDFELLRSGANIADEYFIREIQESPNERRQILIDGENTPRQFLAYTKLPLGSSMLITSIEYNKVFETIAATTRRNIYLAMAVLFISVMVIWFFAKSISIPLQSLALAARNIESGAFEHDLESKSLDEIGVLTASFQKMCAALGIFGKFTNRDIAVRAMRGEIRPGGQPKHATIFFSDIRNFTASSENFTKAFGAEASTRIVDWLNNYFTRMVECVEKTGGTVDKFIGDAVMAHWGAASTTGTPQKDAFSCIFSALMMRKALYEMNKKRSPHDPGNPPVHIGCGINSGNVTAGQIGSDQRMEYTVIGDPVNLASRLESLNKDLGTDILITENTWRLVAKYFITEEMPSVTIKGKEKPIRLFAVINLSGVPEGPQTLGELRELLGLKMPDSSVVDINDGEKKYIIHEKEFNIEDER